jgi:hypothetical protein
VISFTPRPLYPQGKSPQYPLDRKLGGLQSRSRCCGVEKNLLPLSGIELWPLLYRLRLGSIRSYRISTYIMMQTVTRISQFRYTQQNAKMMFLVSLRSMWRKSEKWITLLHRRNAFPVTVTSALAQINSLALQQVDSYMTANRQKSCRL